MRAFVIGSKNLSVEILKGLIDRGHQVWGVITRDEEPGMKVWHDKLGHASLNLEAESLGIPVHEGLNVNSDQCKQILLELNLDIVFSCFWGQIIQQDVLDIPRVGIFNLHTAYLPLNRGSRPIPWSLIRNHEYTGLTIHKMHSGVDNGPIISQVKVAIESKDTAYSLYEKVTNAGAKLFDETLPKFENESFEITNQIDEQATYQPRGEPFGGQINLDWDENKKNRFKRAFTFPPFRAFRNAPKILGKGPCAYFVFDQNLRSIHLTGKEFNYRLESIGDKVLRKKIRELVSEIENVGVQVNFNLNAMYPVHDVFINQTILFTVSQIQFEDDWSSKRKTEQPFRYENGLLEIPAIEVVNARILKDLYDEGTKRALSENRDIFLPFINSSESDIKDISQEISQCGAEQLTFTEVYHHFDTEYEYISTSRL